MLDEPPCPNCGRGSRRRVYAVQGNHLALGLKQRCWVHLLRDIHVHEDPLPQRPAIGPVGNPAVDHIYSAAEELSEQGTPLGTFHGIGSLTTHICSWRTTGHSAVPTPKTSAAARGNLCRRIERHIKELIMSSRVDAVVPSDFNFCGSHPAIPKMLSRKISGGTRSDQGHRHQDDRWLSPLS